MPSQSPQKNAQGYTKGDVENPTVDLVSHLGTRITVPKRRADALLARGLMDIPGGTRGRYRLASEVDAEETSNGVSADKPGPSKPGGSTNG